MRKSNRFKFFSLLLFLCFTPHFLFAQITTVKGNVKDNNGESLIGVRVQILGREGATGTVTDINGNFSITTDANSTLTFAYIGYRTANIPVESRGYIDVVMDAGSQELDEVVVVAYGAQKKLTITGAVSSVSSKELMKSPSASLGNALTGKLPGLSSVQYSGAPGADDPILYVRGIGSLNQDGSRPLVLVDGVERSFTQIDPNEVADISILKDASATAVYGVRGANGVILITTKRGEVGKTSISLSTSWGTQIPSNLLEYTDSYDYAMSYNRALVSDGNAPKFTEEAVQAFKDGSQPLIYPNIDWTDYLMKSSALQSQHNLNITGGSEKARFFVSIGMLSQDGLLKTYDTDKNSNFKYNRYNYRANIDLNLSKSTILSVNLGGRLEVRNTASAGEETIFGNLTNAVPMGGAGIVDGKHIVSNKDYYGGVVGADGLSLFYGKGYRKASTNILNFDMIFSQNLDVITPGLKLQLKGSYNSSSTLQKNFGGSRPTYTSVKQADGTVAFKREGEYWQIGHDYNENSWFDRDWYIEGSLNYQRRFDKHNITALLLYNQSKRYYPSVFNDIPTGYVGMAARATYDYDSRYLLDLNMGYNGSENFAKGKRYGFFPSGSVGWVMSSEEFMKNQNVISFLKFRYSYGLVGNDNMNGRRFLYMPGIFISGIPENWGIQGGGYNFGVNNPVFLPNYHEGVMGNPDVTWETATKQNFGIDLKTFSDRLSLSVDIFNENRKDILIDRSSVIPVYTALQGKAPVVNFGKVENKGYELVMTWNDKVGNNIRYSIAPSMAFNRNKIIEMAEVRQDYPYLYRTGHKVDQPFGYEFWDFYTGVESEEKYKQEFGVSSFPKQMVSTIKPGDAIYVDLNGDGIIDDNDMHAIGYPDYPEYTYALNLSFSYKDFDISMLWNAADNVGRTLWGNYRPQFGAQNSSGLLQWVHDRSWTEETANTASLPSLSFASKDNNTQFSRLWQADASYIRLKNIEIGYNFRNIPKLRAISSARLYMNGYNLLTFSKFKATDPESKDAGRMYPLMKVINIGLRVNF